MSCAKFATIFCISERNLGSDLMTQKAARKVNNEDQKIGKSPEIGALRSIPVVTVCLVLVATPGLARKMECSYDYITHVTTMQLDDHDATNGAISYSYAHSISPVGGEEMFLFSERDPAQLRGAGQLKFIVDKLFFDPLAMPSAIEFVDFERPALKQFQFPNAFLEQSQDTISAPLVVWHCHLTN